MSEETVIPNGIFYDEWLHQVHEGQSLLRWWDWRQRRDLRRSERALIKSKTQLPTFVPPITNDKFFEYPDFGETAFVGPRGIVRDKG